MTLDRPSVYLAGPEVFLPNAVEIGERKKQICAEAGLNGVFPIDVEADLTGLSPRDAGMKISVINQNLLRSCSAVIANVTPFRGISADVGTVFEMGFAEGLGKPVFAYTNVSEPFLARTLHIIGGEHKEGHPPTDSHGMRIENFGLMDNLMLQGGIQSSGGQLVVETAPQSECFTYLKGFELCVQLAAKMLIKT